MKDKSLDREAATQLAYSLWCEHHQSCQKASCHTLKEAFEPYIRQYVNFYVGDFDAYRKAYPDLWQNRQIKADHRFFRPWFDTAFQHHKRGQLYDASQGLPMGDISQKHHVQANTYCMKCQKEHDFDFAIGGILKLVLGAISRDE